MKTYIKQNRIFFILIALAVIAALVVTAQRMMVEKSDRTVDIVLDAKEIELMAEQSTHDTGWGFGPVRKETYDMYDAADTRRDATCWNVGAGNGYSPRYQDTGVFLEKYIAYKENGDSDGDTDLRFNNNLRIYRYAETLLNAAELVQRGAGSGDAAAWLNEVHGRALGGATVALSLENIKEERRLEFVGEGKRYWDLVRWGDAATVLVPDSYGYRTNSWTESKKYLPFPQSLIDATQGKTHVLQQNNY